jgi:hypothetical protein
MTVLAKISLEFSDGSRADCNREIMNQTNDCQAPSKSSFEKRIGRPASCPPTAPAYMLGRGRLRSPFWLPAAPAAALINLV